MLLSQPYDYKADIWSIGVIIYFMLTTGYYLFDVRQKKDPKIEELLQMIKKTIDDEFSRDKKV